MTSVRSAAALALATLCLTLAAQGSILQVDLVVDGERISARTNAEVALFAQDAKPGEPALTCRVGKMCSVPAGIYSMDVVSDDLILVRHPKIQSDPPDVGEPVHPIRLEAIRSAWVVAELPKQAGYRLDLLDISSGAVFHGLFGPAMKRLKVPARDLVGALRDGSRHLGLFRLTPKAGETIALQPPASPDRGRGQLLCSFVFPDASKTGGYSGLLPTLLIGEKRRPPDILVTGDPWHVWAVWFTVPAGPFKVETHDPIWTPRSPVQGEIPDRGTLSLQGLAMLQKPSLSSTLSTSERLAVTPVEMALFDCAAFANAGWPIRLPACTPVASGTGNTGSPLLFEHLTPSFFALQWHASHFTGIRLIDMRDGRSRSEEFAPEILRISGRVRRGDKPVSTTVSFVEGVTDTRYQATSDESGEYEVLVCPRSLYSASVRVEGQGDYFETLDVMRDVVHDIDLPLNLVVIQVRDAGAGESVPNAVVTFNLRADGSGRGGKVNSDGDGRATLPPLQRGVLTYGAAAKGYRESTRQVLELKESTQAELVVLLTRAPEGTLQVLEADGTPAVYAVASWRDGYIAGPANAEGMLNVDESLGEGGAISVVNRRGELSVFRWSGEGDHVFTMQPPGPPITLRFETAAGKPARYQLPRYALDGIAIPHPLDLQARLRGGGDANSRRDGVMIISGLPGSGLLTLWPALHPELSVTEPLPVKEIVRLQAVDNSKAP